MPFDGLVNVFTTLDGNFKMPRRFRIPDREKRVLLITLAIALVGIILANLDLYFSYDTRFPKLREYNLCFMVLIFNADFAWIALAIIGGAIGAERRRDNSFFFLLLLCVLIVILYAYSTLYFLTGVKEVSDCSSSTTPWVKVTDPRKLMYFSVMTWTTVGFGDIIPATSRARSIALYEGLNSYFIMALFVSSVLALGQHWFAQVVKPKQKRIAITQRIRKMKSSKFKKQL